MTVGMRIFAFTKFVIIVRVTQKDSQWYKVIYSKEKGFVERKYKHRMEHGQHTCQKKDSKHVKRE
jgi:hypothetical protein